MTSILSTNAKPLFDADGDFMGYDLPDADPVSVDYRWIKKWGCDDELVYRVEWADGTWAELFSLPNKWNHLRMRSSMARAA